MCAGVCGLAREREQTFEGERCVTGDGGDGLLEVMGVIERYTKYSQFCTFGMIGEGV